MSTLRSQWHRGEVVCSCLYHPSVSRQVTKKRVSANKKNRDTQEFYNAARTQQAREPEPRLDAAAVEQAASTDAPSSSPAAQAQATPPRQNRPAAGHTPGSASKRKQRKLAVNFEAAKVSE